MNEQRTPLPGRPTVTLKDVQDARAIVLAMADAVARRDRSAQARALWSARALARRCGLGLAWRHGIVDVGVGKRTTAA